MSSPDPYLHPEDDPADPAAIQRADDDRAVYQGPPFDLDPIPTKTRSFSRLVHITPEALIRTGFDLCQEVEQRIRREIQAEVDQWAGRHLTLPRIDYRWWAELHPGPHPGNDQISWDPQRDRIPDKTRHLVCRVTLNLTRLTEPQMGFGS